MKRIDELIINTESFLKAIIPILPANLDEIFKHLVENQFYQPDNETWRNMPATLNNPSEISIYQPFADIANEINTFAIQRDWVGKDQIKGQWVNGSSTAPTTTTDSTEETKFKIRPDMAFVSVQTNPHILDEWQKDTERRMTRSELEGEVSDEDLDSKAIWWMQMLSVVKINKDWSKSDTKDALNQLSCYVQEIFRHQADRRFVIGLTLCANILGFYFFDRSGVLGTDRYININREPLKFVQILAAFSLLHFEDMGWDPTMTLFDRDLPEPVPSFSYSWKKVNNDSFKPQWVILLGGVSYVTLLDVQKLDTQEMYGKATVVWEVCELAKFRTRICDGAEILVLKQSWQPLPEQADEIPELKRVPLEQYCYTKANIVKGGLKWAEYVLNENGQIVSTLKVKCNHDVQNRRSRWRDDAFKVVRVERRLTRILMERRGYKLWRFKNLEELLLAFSNAVKTHKKLYDAGILHRDVSPNNIIIFHHSQQTDDEVAGLIDYDHVKIAERFESWLHIKSWLGERTRPTDRYLDDADAKLNSVQKALKTDGIILSLTAARGCLQVAEQRAILKYLPTMFKRFPFRYPTNEDGKEMELEDLSLKEPDSSLPFFSPEINLDNHAGTLPYMSHQIIPYRQPKTAIRSPIHDMESLFWILIHYTLTYEGPGGLDATELTQESIDSFKKYFEFGYSRSEIFFPIEFSEASDTLKKIVSHIQEYFKPLQNLIEEWWKTLYTAYEFVGFEFVNTHFHIAAILQKTLEDVRAMNLPVHEYTIKEEIRRKKLDRAMRRAFKNQHMIIEEDMADDLELEGNL